jgi:hypothetical protein
MNMSIYMNMYINMHMKINVYMHPIHVQPWNYIYMNVDMAMDMDMDMDMKMKPIASLLNKSDFDQLNRLLLQN